MARRTPQLASGAATSVVSTPSLASARSWPWNARVEISSETVNPMPATAPPPITDAHPTGGVIRPRLIRVRNAEAPAMPIGLPST